VGRRHGVARGVRAPVWVTIIPAPRPSSTAPEASALFPPGFADPALRQLNPSGPRIARRSPPSGIRRHVVSSLWQFDLSRFGCCCPSRGGESFRLARLSSLARRLWRSATSRIRTSARADGCPLSNGEAGSGTLARRTHDPLRPAHNLDEHGRGDAPPDAIDLDEVANSLGHPGRGGAGSRGGGRRPSGGPRG
jgi:hypothetical protein